MLAALANYTDSESENEAEETKCLKSANKVSQNCGQSKKNEFVAEENSIVCSDEDECEGGSSKMYKDECNINGAELIKVIQEPSDEDDSTSEDSDYETESKRKKISDQVLDNPFRWSNSGDTDAKNESVFQIAFREQEDKKAAALERHVKMTATAGAVQMINGKKICWNHRKGKCRFGHNCTFAHDTDLQGEDTKNKKT